MLDTTNLAVNDMLATIGFEPVEHSGQALLSNRATRQLAVIRADNSVVIYDASTYTPKPIYQITVGGSVIPVGADD
jgi:hypothetical protein